MLIRLLVLLPLQIGRGVPSAYTGLEQSLVVYMPNECHKWQWLPPCQTEDRIESSFIW